MFIIIIDCNFFRFCFVKKRTEINKNKNMVHSVMYKQHIKYTQDHTANKFSLVGLTYSVGTPTKLMQTRGPKLLKIQFLF